MAVTPTVIAPQGAAFAVFNIQSAGVRVAQAAIDAVVKVSTTMEVSQAAKLAVVRGRVQNTELYAFTYTIDQHDHYALRIGDAATLVYDTYSQAWQEFASPNLEFWRARTGINWVGGMKWADEFGSNIVVGDDTAGLLWILDPDLAWDEHPDPTANTQELPFERIVMGQITANGRQNVPCYDIFLQGDVYGITGNSFVASVLMSMSDDSGVTYQDQDVLFVATPDVDPEQQYAWYSLGQISSPGRLFKFVDNGVFTRIDAASMNND